MAGQLHSIHHCCQTFEDPYVVFFDFVVCGVVVFAKGRATHKMRDLRAFFVGST